MNSVSPLSNIKSYDDLRNERQRLEELIRQQKNLIRHDLDNLKADIKQELRPAIKATNFIKKFTAGETRNQTILQAGSTVLIDIVLRRLFAKSGFLIQLILPGLLKNFSANTVTSLLKNISSQKKLNNTGRLNGSHTGYAHEI